jgi:nucleoid-associated protein YgaU
MSKDKKTTPVVEATAGVNTDQVLSAEQIAKAEADKAAADKAEADKAEADKVAADKAAADKAEADKAAADKAAADKAASEEVHEAKMIPSGIFVAENGDSFEFAVGQFTFQGKVYTKEEALSDHTDVLEHLISVKSFILKKV